MFLTRDFDYRLRDALCDQFIAGIHNNVSKRRLLIESKLTFDKANQIAYSLEVADKEIPGLHTKNNQAVSIVSNSIGTVQFVKGKHKGGGKPHSKQGRFNATASMQNTGCHCCGTKQHWAPQSPHKEDECNKYVKLEIDLKFVEVAQQLHLKLLVLYHLLMEIQTKEILVQYFIYLLLML